MSVAPLWDHVAELRRALLYSLIAILIATCVALFFYQDVFHWLTLPLNNSSLHHHDIRRERILNTDSKTILYTLPDKNTLVQTLSADVKTIKDSVYEIPQGAYIDVDRLVPQHTLAVFGPVEGMLITFKVCFWLGVVLAAPFWVYFVLNFIMPALRADERRLILPFLGLSLLFMSTGACLAYLMTIPMANQYLQVFNASIGLNFWSLSQYLDYTLFLVLANALAFEMGVILLFLVHYGVLTASMMASKRRHMIVMAFILGALLTPPDVLTQFMLAIPLMGLYELILIYARFLQARKGNSNPEI